MKIRFAKLCGLLMATSLLSSCTETTPKPTQPPLGPIAEEVFGVFCDRFGANTFREDMTGASFRALCHRTNGQYENEVDLTKLPTLTADAVDDKGVRVALRLQEAHRAKRLTAMKRLVARRADLLEAIGSVVSDDLIDMKNTAQNGAASCDAVSARATLVSELGAMLQRMGPVYQDGSLQGLLSGVDPVLEAFGKSPNAINGWRAIRARAGYRPGPDAFSGARAVLADPLLFDNLGELLRAVGPHVEPTDVGSPAAAGHKALLSLMGAARVELNNLASTEHSHVSAAPDASGKIAPTRARSGLEFAVALMSTESNMLKMSATDRYVVRRDSRGLPWVAGTGSLIKTPFVDADGDHRADIDTYGNFQGIGLPTPFADLGSDPTTTRDARGVALTGGTPAFEVLNVSKSWGAASLPELHAVFAAPGNRWAQVARAVPVVLGARAASTRRYADGTSLSYQGYQANSAPILDLSWALTHTASSVQADRLLSVVGDLLEKHPDSVARLVKAVLAAKDVANKDTLGTYPDNAYFWDEILRALSEIADVPGLLQAVVVNTADQRLSVASVALSRMIVNRDKYDYDRNNLNGSVKNLSVASSSWPAMPVDRTKPDTGDNRSIFQHFAQMIAELDGVALCTKDGASAHIRGLPFVNTFELPLSGTYRECEVIKVDNLAYFYLQALVGSPKAAFNMRPPLMNVGVAPGTVDMMQRSTGILGFWMPADSTVLTPKPAFINRLAFFDLKNDSPTEGSGPNYITNHFLVDLMPAKVGTNLCESRDIPDPCADGSCHGNDVRADKMVRGLRNCRAGEWLQDRHPKTVFSLETGGLLESLFPLVKPFVDAGREDLFVRLMSIASKHWQSDAGTAQECRVVGGSCAKTGLSSYEPLVGQLLQSDLVPALVAFSIQADATRVKQCSTMDAAGRCTAVLGADPSGLDLLADATRVLASPAESTAHGLSDRRGNTAVTWKDGSRGAHLTPLNLLVDALVKIDASYMSVGADGALRKKSWREARSSLVDNLLKTEGTAASIHFASTRFAPLLATSLKVIRGEAAAHCPKSFVAPFEKCAWLETELNNDLEETVSGPLVASAFDLLDATTQNPAAVAALSRMLASSTNPAHAEDRVLPIAQSTVDAMAAAQDTRAVRALLPVLTLALDAQARPQPLDATISLLGRVGLSPTDGTGARRCDLSIDPNRALPQALVKAMTPLAAGAHKGATPLELLADAVADINRDSQDALPAPNEADYMAITAVLRNFLSSKENGMSQVITTIQKALVP